MGEMAQSAAARLHPRIDTAPGVHNNENRRPHERQENNNHAASLRYTVHHQDKRFPAALVSRLRPSLRRRGP